MSNPIIIFIITMVLLSSCDPVHDLSLINNSGDTIEVITCKCRESTVYEMIDNGKVGKKINNIYEEKKIDSIETDDPLEDIYYYKIGPNGQLEIGDRIGFGSPSSQDLYCTYLKIITKKDTILATNKEDIVKLMTKYKLEVK